MNTIDKLIKVANLLDRKGLHSFANKLDSLMNIDLSHTKDSEDIVKSPSEDLIEVADILDRKGLKVIADNIDRIVESGDLERDADLDKDALETTLLFYRDIHKMASKIPGGLAEEENKILKDFDKDQIQKGIKIELEHTDDEKIAEEIAMDHLTEDPKYYTKLEEIEGTLKQFCKHANVRKENLPYEERCPLELSIPGDCKDCPYAAEVLEKYDAVVCSWGTTTEGKTEPAIYRGSPLYPRLWSGFNSVDIGRGTTNPDFGYDAGFYR